MHYTPPKHPHQILYAQALHLLQSGETFESAANFFEAMLLGSTHAADLFMLKDELHRFITTPIDKLHDFDGLPSRQIFNYILCLISRLGIKSDDSVTVRLLNFLSAELTRSMTATDSKHQALLEKVMILLGFMHEHGRVVGGRNHENAVVAVSCYQFAALLGNSNAEAYLGSMYMEGRGVSGTKEENDREAVKWLLLSANKGNASAQDNLGVMYMDGRGVGGINENNDRESLKWLRLSAAQDFSLSELHLAFAYKNGYGVGGMSKENECESVKWIRRASLNGSVSNHWHFVKIKELLMSLNDINLSFQIFGILAREHWEHKPRMNEAYFDCLQLLVINRVSPMANLAYNLIGGLTENIVNILQDFDGDSSVLIKQLLIEIRQDDDRIGSIATSNALRVLFNPNLENGYFHSLLTVEEQALWLGTLITTVYSAPRHLLTQIKEREEKREHSEAAGSAAAAGSGLFASVDIVEDIKPFLRHISNLHLVSLASEDQSAFNKLVFILFSITFTELKKNSFSLLYLWRTIESIVKNNLTLDKCNQELLPLVLAKFSHDQSILDKNISELMPSLKHVEGAAAAGDEGSVPGLDEEEGVSLNRLFQLADARMEVDKVLMRKIEKLRQDLKNIQHKIENISDSSMFSSTVESIQFPNSIGEIMSKRVATPLAQIYQLINRIITVIEGGNFHQSMAEITQELQQLQQINIDTMKPSYTPSFFKLDEFGLSCAITELQVCILREFTDAATATATAASASASARS